MNPVLSETGALRDAAVIERILGGDAPLFEILIRRYNPVLYKIGRSFGFNHHDTEDLMQETHVSAYQHLAQFGGRASYKTWLSKIMLHKCGYKWRYGYHKHEQPTETIAEPGTAHPPTSGPTQPEAQAVNRELAAIIEHSLQKIPLLYRTVFVLREIEGFSVAETAGLVGITATNVKVRLNRAKALLQKEIEQVYSRPEIYSFHLAYCDGIVHRVLERLAPPPAGAPAPAADATAL